MVSSTAQRTVSRRKNYLQRNSIALAVTARSELRNVLFLELSVAFLFVYEMAREPLNGFAPNSHGRRV